MPPGSLSAATGGSPGAFRRFRRSAPPSGVWQLELAVSHWLRSLDIHLPVDAETGSRLGVGPPLDDPLRNGVLLCALTNLLLRAEAEARPVEKASKSSKSAVSLPRPAAAVLPYCKRPTTLAQAQQNIDGALGALQRRGLPAGYLVCTEQVLKGHSEAIWGLLYEVMQLFPPHLGDAARACAPVTSPRHGYTALQSRELERSLLGWLTALGLLHAPDPPPDETTTPTTAPPLGGPVLDVIPEELESPFVLPYIRNGTLLLKLIEALEGHRITGVLWAPRTKGTCLANLRKATALLRDRKGMSKWYLDFEDEVFAGDKVIILALLEDLHRYFDGLPSRSGPIRRGDVPYLGNSSIDFDGYAVTAEQSSSGFIDPDHTRGRPRSSSPGQTAGPPTHPKGRPLKPGPSPSALNAGARAPTKSAPLNPSSLSDQPASKPQPGTGALGARPAKSAKSQASKPWGSSRPLTPSPPRNSAGLSRQHPDTSKNQPDGLTSPDALAPPSTLSAASNPPSSFLLRSPSPEPSAPGEATAARAQTLTRWLEFLGVHPPPLLAGPRFEAFCDGTLLCHIVSILTHSTIQGVEWAPKSKAAMRHNMERALLALQSDKNLALDWLFLCEDLLDGKPGTILDLLGHLKKAYHYFVSTVAKPLGAGSAPAAGSAAQRR